MMVSIRPPDIVLAYLKDNQSGTEQEVFMGINSLVKDLWEKDVFTPIDFKFYKHGVRSDVIKNILWEFSYSGLIKEVDGVYTMTKYGNKIVDQLLQSFMESKVGGVYAKVRPSNSEEE